MPTDAMGIEVQGVDWRGVQARLTALGFRPGPIDGIRGPLTDAAIVAFKRSIGFNPRPLYGPLTHEALLGQPAEAAGTMPPWLAEGFRMKGLHERRDNARLAGWFHDAVDVDPAEIPWCGAFVATCLKRVLPDTVLPVNPLGARNWMSYGEPSHGHIGAVAVFWRVRPSDWRGHVAFAVGQDATTIHVLGGNQSDAVTVTRMPRDRLLGYTWPAGEGAGIPLPRMQTGGTISTNEA